MPKSVFITTETLGRGDRELGGVLMKNFLYTLARQDDAPVAIMLMNDGVRLACAGSASLDDLALKHIKELPIATRHALSGLGILNGGGGVLASYLLFEPGFVQTLIAMGESDAYARKAELLEFFAKA